MKGRGSKFDKCEDKVGNTLSALLFVLVMIPLTLLLRKIKISNQLKKRRERINHVLFMDNLKLCAKSEDQLKSLINTVRIFPDDITLDFGLSKCDLLIMKIGKMLRTERIMGTRWKALKKVLQINIWKFWKKMKKMKPKLMWTNFSWKNQQKGGRLIDVEDCVLTGIHSLKYYLMRNGEKLLEDVQNSGLLENRNTTSKKDLQKDPETT